MNNPFTLIIQILCTLYISRMIFTRHGEYRAKNNQQIIWIVYDVAQILE